MMRRKNFPEFQRGYSLDELFKIWPKELIGHLCAHFDKLEEYSNEISAFRKILDFKDKYIEDAFDDLHYAVMGERIRICCFPRPDRAIGLKYVHSSRDALLRCKYRADAVNKIVTSAHLLYANQQGSQRSFPSDFSLNGGLDRAIMYEFFDFIVCCRSFLDRFSRFLMWVVGGSTKINYSKFQKEILKFRSISGVDEIYVADSAKYHFKKFILYDDSIGDNLRNTIAHDDHVPFVNVRIDSIGVWFDVDPHFVSIKNDGSAEKFFDEIVDELNSYVAEMSRLLIIDWRSIVET